jgi:hypothetical protein
LPGADWRADPWGKADVLSPLAPRTAIHAALSEVVRISGGQPNFLALVVRGASNDNLVEPILVSSGDELIDENQFVEPGRLFLAQLRKDQPSAGVFRGKAEHLGLQGLGNPLAGLVRVRRPGHYLTVWISPKERRAIFEGRRLDSVSSSIAALGVPFEMGETRELEELLHGPVSATGKSSLRDEEIAELVLDFATTSNTAALSALAGAKGVYTQAFADLRATQVYLVAQSSSIRCVGTLGKGGYDFLLDVTDQSEGVMSHCIRPMRRDPGAPR